MDILMCYRGIFLRLGQGIEILSRWHTKKLLCVVIMSFVGVTGCRMDGPQGSTMQDIEAFDLLGPGLPGVDIDKIVKARLPRGPHLVVAEEVLEISMPGILHVVTANDSQPIVAEKPLRCRVNAEGTIVLPVIGHLHVSGLNLPEIETRIVNAYYPKYTKHHPTVYAEIIEKKMYRVSITGAVNQPGLYDLPYDEMSLVALLMQAGGIDEKGAASIRIIRSSHPSVSPNQASDGRRLLPPDDNAHAVLSMASFPPAPFGQKTASGYKLAFQPLGVNNTQGQVVLRQNERELFRQSLDLSNRSERIAMLRQVTHISVDLDATQINQHLLSLLTILQSQVKPVGFTNVSTDQADGTDHRLRYAGHTELNPAWVRRAAKTERATHQPIHDEPIPQNEQMIVLPVKNLNIPFVDLALHEGDNVIVEKLQIPMFSVLGLVSKPGNFEYPPHEDYNLIEAIGFAGGLNPDLAPRYATVYRLGAEGEIRHIRVDIRKAAQSQNENVPSGMRVRIKPGDIVAVEDSPRTRTNKFLRDTFRLNIGLYTRNLGDLNLFDDE